MQFNPERVAYSGATIAEAMPQSLSCVLIHAVFSTKSRHPFLADEAFRKEIQAYIGGVSKRLDCPPVAIGGVDDHVHALVRFPSIPGALIALPPM